LEVALRLLPALLLILAACTDVGLTTGLTFGDDGVSVQNSVTGSSGNASITIGN
jgi:hypothetical protein